MKKNKLLYLFLICILFFTSSYVLAAYKEIDGWEWIEIQGRAELWQRRNSYIISEAMLNNRPSLCNEIIRGYSIKFIDEGNIPDFYFYDFPLSIWKIYYQGLDGSGNVYLKIHRIKDGLTKEEILYLMKLIEEISNEGIDDNYNSEELLKKRFFFFNEELDQYLDKEGETIIVDSSKSVVINSVEEIPPLNILKNDSHTVLNVSIGLDG